jgi:hypothetical protein
VSNDYYPKNGKKGLRTLSIYGKLVATGNNALARQKIGVVKYGKEEGNSGGCQ